MIKRCPYCFKPLPENGVCDCHYLESDNAHIEFALRPGTVVGEDYIIGGVLGQGGFGITYIGYDIKLEKIVAIKEFFPKELVTRQEQISADGQRIYTNSVQTLTTKKTETYHKARKMFYREAQSLAKLSKYENIVHVYRTFEENETVYFVMDYVDGKSLSQILKEKGRFSESELIPMLDPVLLAMEKVHEEGLLHRDIAPDNIIINEIGQPILLDFGAAKIETNDKTTSQPGKKTPGSNGAPSEPNSEGYPNNVPESTGSSLVVEKKGYTPIEQIGGQATKRSDIYALGATYYHLLSGQVPPESYLRRSDKKKDPIVPLTEFGISKQTSNAVMKALAFDEENRWESVADFQEALPKDDPKLSRKKLLPVCLSLLIVGIIACLIISHFHGEQNLILQTQTANLETLNPYIDETNVPAGTLLPTDTVPAVFSETTIPTNTAAGNTPVPSPAFPVPESRDEWNSIQPGSRVLFGKHDTVPLSWIVLEIDKENNRALLFREWAEEELKFNEELENSNWEHSTLRVWLNNDFIKQHFTENESGRLQTVHLHDEFDANKVTDSRYQVSDTDDMVFPLSLEELNYYIDSAHVLKTGKTFHATWNKGDDTLPTPIGYGSTYWLRDNNSDDSALVILGNGNAEGADFDTNQICIRPALWIDLGE